MKKIIIPVDEDHRILQIGNKLYPQWKGLIRWRYYKFIDYCQDFKYTAEGYFTTKEEREEEIESIKTMFPIYDEARIEHGGIL